MKSDPIYQIGIFGENSTEKLHEFKSYDLPVKDYGLTFKRVNGSIEKVTGSIKEVSFAQDEDPSDNIVPVNVYIQIDHRAKIAKKA